MNCRGCGKAITHYLDKWWDASEDFACDSDFGEHVPMVVIKLPAQKAYPTLGPVAKARSTSTRLLPLSTRRKTIKMRRLVTDD